MREKGEPTMTASRGTQASLSFTHRFVPGTDPTRPPILLLHGTGGDEDDLIPLGQAVSPGSALLSPRGKVLEGGMPRFFRRFAEGVFDEADVRARAAELAAFVAQAREAYGVAAPIAVGYSNGANIAAAVMLLHPQALAGAALLRGMEVLSDPPVPDLRGRRTLLVSGASDPIIPAASAASLKAALEKAGAAVDHRVLRAGHGLTQEDVSAVAGWLQSA
jgi:phospholipase/carboxylesterase